jgi:hypothetical protein
MDDSEKEAAETELLNAVEAFLKEKMAKGVTMEEAVDLARRLANDMRTSVVDERRKALKIVGKT